MTRIFAAAILLGLASCATNNDSSALACTHLAHCAAGFPNNLYGPIQAQAVAPDPPSPLRPQR